MTSSFKRTEGDDVFTVYNFLCQGYIFQTRLFVEGHSCHTSFSTRTITRMDEVNEMIRQVKCRVDSFNIN